MILPSFLFSPHARVWNLRLLLLGTLGLSGFLVATLSSAGAEYSSPGRPLISPYPILLPTFGCMFLHHLGLIINWPIPRLAIVDLILVFLESCGITVGFHLAASWQELPTLFKFAWIPLDLSLILSIIFRIATMVRSEGRFFHQKFVFLGACTRSSPLYTPTAILLNRSVARPLVRGESMIIILARALVLTCISLGVPVFGIYAIVLNPIHASIYTRSVATFSVADLSPPPGNITFLMGLFQTNAPFSNSSTIPDFSVNNVAVAVTGYEGANCSVTFEEIGTQRLVECSQRWWALGDGWTISINLTIPSGYAVNVMPLPQKSTMGPFDALPSRTINEIGIEVVRLQVFSDSILMISGSHLFARLTWTQRETRSRWGLGGLASSAPVFEAQITNLQPYPSASPTATNETTLLLYQPYPFATRLQQDSSDITPLSGLSTFGGFWTFVEGVFVLLFGASVMYFAFGRRPLSALGLIHIFHRRALVQQWHDDFPRLRTEGGQPGSESAGIVAFIRERLIDIDQGPEMDTVNDIEAQHSRSSSDSQEDLIRASTKEPDYEHGQES
ncbi:hypothetical protein MSAN_01647100 [Mycena sanguinolenta]|uniref:Transmembrane protein n=1 Tax=Mycena sanguinolenta TaxID=230812 RepID=A0A8H6XYU7_9AGAR|nr:hypothetical protein MSAN_01647100 [Mycena sanguinolenta]